MADPCRAVEQLLYIYAERIDAGDFRGVSELFARGWIAGPDGNVIARGSDEVRGLYESSTRPLRVRHTVYTAYDNECDHRARPNGSSRQRTIPLHSLPMSARFSPSSDYIRPLCGSVRVYRWPVGFL